MALPIALQGSQGTWMVNGPTDVKVESRFERDPGNSSRGMLFSNDGRLFAYNNGKAVRIVDTDSYQLVQEIEKPRTSCMFFSPKGTFLALWESYTVDKDSQTGIPNLNIYNVATGKCVRSLIQKKVTYWAPQWTDDEKLCCRNVNNELHFFEDGNFDEIKTKLHLQKVSGHSLCGAGPPYMVAGYVPGGKGQPSFVRVYKYPNFGGPNSAVSNRTFFKADKLEMLWNRPGTALLLLTTTDTSESSYYGDQGLHFLGMNGESSLVHLGKNGPVYHVEWSPKGNEFCVVYGFMPAKATIYNMKTEPVFDFGTGPRNMAYYNPQGTVLCLCGFGNLRGNMEFWDVKQKRLISQPQAPDTTAIVWAPDGEHVLTATCAPRLRVGNGYRIWHCTGTELYHEPTEKGQELWQARWQPAPLERFPEKTISYKLGPTPAQAPDQEKKPAAYVPPSLRGQQKTQSTKLHEYELPSNMKQTQSDPNRPMTKNKKKKEAKKAKKLEQGGFDQQDFELPEAAASAPPPGASAGNPAPFQSSGDPDKDKRIRNLKKKIQQIENLKDQKKAGKKLEKNQEEKLKTECTLLKELEELEIR